MSDTLAEASQYLAPPNDGWWSWSEDGQWLVAPGEQTIAIRQEVEAVLERLAPGGLPRFGSVVLLLAACRDGWKSSELRSYLAGLPRSFGQMQSNVDATPDVRGSTVALSLATRRLLSVLNQLDRVSDLPEDVRHGTKAKSILAEAVFEPIARSDRGHAAKVLRAINEGIPAEALSPHVPSDDPMIRFAEDAGPLESGLPTIDAESLRMRARTGLDAPPGSADLEPPYSDQIRRLLGKLRTDVELSGLAQLAQNLMAAVHVPRTLHAQEELPVGGVSDLSNRGSLDRLLVSELANDPLTLAVRVALNEALYLRRESPPRDPPRQRALLLDSGIRMWGVPRVFAIAAALAFAATADRRSALAAFRALANSAEPIDLVTRDGVMDCLAALEPEPHPGSALRPFLELVAARSAELSEIILLTHPDVLRDAEFAKALAGQNAPPLVIATVDRDGWFRCWSYTRAGRRLLTEARLDLSHLTQTRRPRTPLVRTPAPAELPAIFSVDPFPLRLPCSIKPLRAAAAEGLGLVGISNDGRLMHWDKPGYPGRQLTALTPKHPPLGIFIHPDAALATAVFSDPLSGHVQVVNATLTEESRGIARLQLRVPKPVGCFPLSNGRILCIVSSDVHAFSLGNGAQLAQLRLPIGVKWLRGRFFQSAGKHFALGYDGSRLTLEPIPFAHDHLVLTIFDRPGVDGPFALRVDGSVEQAGSDQLVVNGSFPRPAGYGGVSSDGNILVVVPSQPSRHHFLDLRQPSRWKPVVQQDWREILLQPHFEWSRSRIAMAPAHFDTVFTEGTDELGLIHSSPWRISAAHPGRGITRDPARAAVGSRLRLAEFPAPSGMRIRLASAEWPDGSRVVSDSRRLLHLRSADRSIPELTIVLCERGLAGWASDGRVFGHPMFHVSGTPSPIEELGAILREFLVRLP